jgi:hypothetical protein
VKRLLILVLAAALGWSAFWVWQARGLRAETASWFEDRRAEGWAASFEALSLRGFPNRLDLTVEGLRLADPETRIVWEAPFVQILRLVYDPGHVILAFADNQTIAVAGRRHALSSDGLRASIVTRDGRIARANLEADVLNVEGPDRALALAGLAGALQRVEGLQRAYRLGLSAEAAAFGEGGALPRPVNADGLQLQAEVIFDREWTPEALSGPRPQPERIDLRLAEYRIGDLVLRLTGAMDVDSLGRADGRLDIRAENWRAAMDTARETGSLPDWLSDTLEGGLGLMAQLSGRADTVDVTITLDDGQMTAGLIPLGPAPRLRLP